MPFQPASGVWEVGVDMQCQGLPAAHVFHVKPSQAQPVPSMETVALEILAWYTTQYAPLVHVGWSLTQIRIRDLTTENGAQHVTFGNGGAVGQLAGDPLPGGVALALKKSTGMAGKSARGRIYTVGHNSSQLNSLNGNQFDVTVCDAFVAAFDALLADLQAINAPMVVLSRWSNKVLRAAGLARAVVNFVCVDMQVDSQRGRTKP